MVGLPDNLERDNSLQQIADPLIQQQRLAEALLANLPRHDLPQPSLAEGIEWQDL